MSVLKTKSKPNLKKAYPSDQKERGEWVELLFMANAARMGLKVAKPHGESSRYDVIVEGDGKLQRVQVKSTMSEYKRCYECLCFWSTGSAKARVTQEYSKEDIDLVAAYVVPEDTWFLIPISEIKGKRLFLPSRERAGRSRYGQFLEAWHLLGVKTQGLTIHASVESDLVMALIKFKLAETIKEEESSMQNEE